MPAPNTNEPKLYIYIYIPGIVEFKREERVEFDKSLSGSHTVLYGIALLLENLLLVTLLEVHYSVWNNCQSYIPLIMSFLIWATFVIT